MTGPAERPSRKPPETRTAATPRQINAHRSRLAPAGWRRELAAAHAAERKQLLATQAAARRHGAANDPARRALMPKSCRPSPIAGPTSAACRPRSAQPPRRRLAASRRQRFRPARATLPASSIINAVPSISSGAICFRPSERRSHGGSTRRGREQRRSSGPARPFAHPPWHLPGQRHDAANRY